MSWEASIMVQYNGQQITYEKALEMGLLNNKPIINNTVETEEHDIRLEYEEDRKEIVLTVNEKEHVLPFSTVADFLQIHNRRELINEIRAGIDYETLEELAQEIKAL